MKLIKIGGLYVDPERVIAVSNIEETHMVASGAACLIWIGPTDQDYFLVRVSKEEAVKKINKAQPTKEELNNLISARIMGKEKN